MYSPFSLLNLPTRGMTSMLAFAHVLHAAQVNICMYLKRNLVKLLVPKSYSMKCSDIPRQAT